MLNENHFAKMLNENNFASNEQIRNLLECNDKTQELSECNDKTKDLRFCLRGKYTVGNSTILKEVLRTLMELSYIIYRSV